MGADEILVRLEETRARQHEGVRLRDRVGAGRVGILRRELEPQLVAHDGQSNRTRDRSPERRGIDRSVRIGLRRCVQDFVCAQRAKRQNGHQREVRHDRATVRVGCSIDDDDGRDRSDREQVKHDRESGEVRNKSAPRDRRRHAHRAPESMRAERARDGAVEAEDDAVAPDPRLDQPRRAVCAQFEFAHRGFEAAFGADDTLVAALLRGLHRRCDVVPAARAFEFRRLGRVSVHARQASARRRGRSRLLRSARDATGRRDRSGASGRRCLRSRRRRSGR